MKIIRVTKTSSNRVDAIFTGDKYLFFHADFGLVAVAQRGQHAKQDTENHFIILRSEQISEEMIKSTIEKNESTFKISSSSRASTTSRNTLYHT